MPTILTITNLVTFEFLYLLNFQNIKRLNNVFSPTYPLSNSTICLRFGGILLLGTEIP